MYASKVPFFGGSWWLGGSNAGLFHLYVDRNETWASSSTPDVGSNSYNHTSATTYYSDFSHFYASKFLSYSGKWDDGSVSGMIALLTYVSSSDHRTGVGSTTMKRKLTDFMN